MTVWLLSDRRILAVSSPLMDHPFLHLPQICKAKEGEGFWIPRLDIGLFLSSNNLVWLSSFSWYVIRFRNHLQMSNLVVVVEEKGQPKLNDLPYKCIRSLFPLLNSSFVVLRSELSVYDVPVRFSPMPQRVCNHRARL